MKKKILWLILSFLMALTLVLASCGPAVTEEEDVVTEEEEEVVTEEEEEAVVEKGPQYGGTLRVNPWSTGEPPGWDPAIQSWLKSVYFGIYYEHLLGGDQTRGSQGTNEYSFLTTGYVPDEFVGGWLAESWETPDLLTIIFHLRQGIFWQNKPPVNGREFVANDVVFTWNRNLESPSFSTAKYEFIDSVAALDKYTVVFKLNTFSNIWMEIIGWGLGTEIYAHEVVEAGINDLENAVSTGPFMLTDYVVGVTTYEKNPDYWRKWTIDGKEYSLPFVDRILYFNILDRSIKLAAFRTGRLDYYGWALWASKEPLLETNPEITAIGVTSSPSIVHFRHEEAPFDDVKVRKALSMAIDRYAARDVLYGGEGDILWWPFNKAYGESLFTPLEELPPETREQFEYDPERAKQLLAEAGYPNGFETEMIGTTQHLEDYDFIVAYWKDIGVDCSIKILEYATFMTNFYAGTYKGAASYTTGFPTPSNALSDWFAPDGRKNTGSFNDPYVAEQLAAISLEADAATRLAMMKELNLNLLSKCVYFQLPAQNYYIYYHPWVKNLGGLSYGYYTYGPPFSICWIDQQLKEEMGY